MSNTTLGRLQGQVENTFANDAIDALAFRAGIGEVSSLSSGAQTLARKPLWAIAAESLQVCGHQPDLYGDRALLAEQACSMGPVGKRTTFFSDTESPLFAASSGPANRPGDFPSILSGLANKILDDIDLSEEYSYPEISALHTTALKDFKPVLMANKSSVDELDEVSDGVQFLEIGLQEETLSYLFLRRFGNKFGLTPVMIANDDMDAFSDGLAALAEAWRTTQNRLVLERLTQNETLLDGNALFSNRPDIGSATNNNDKATGLAPSDSEWGSMETLFSGMSGIGTSRRVRGELNTILVPTGAAHQAARRTFDTMLGESKVATTTDNVGLYRGRVRIVAEPELNDASQTAYYGLRDPKNKKTATILRAYFAGFGEKGRRESWWDPETKSAYVSLEGRIGVAVKNYRYAVRNAGTGG